MMESEQGGGRRRCYAKMPNCLDREVGEVKKEQAEEWGKGGGGGRGAVRRERERERERERDPVKLAQTRYLLSVTTYLFTLLELGKYQVRNLRDVT